MSYEFENLSLNDFDDEKILSSMKYVVDAVCYGRIYCDNLVQNMPAITHILDNYGSLITDVTIDGSFMWNLNQWLLTQLNEKCKNVKRLRLICFRFRSDEIEAMKILIQNVEVIEFFYCTLGSKRLKYDAFLENARALKELIYIGRNEEITLKCLNDIWPYIEKLQIISAKLKNETVLWYFLLKNYKTLKHYCYMANTPYSFDPCTTNLTELSMVLDEEMKYDELEGLVKLQGIVISLNNYKKSIRPFAKILENMDSLNVLGIWHMKFEQFSKLPKMTNIRTLELREFKSKVDPKILSSEIDLRWSDVKDLYLDHSVIRNVNDLELFVVDGQQLENIFLCNLKGFHIIPNEEEYNSWCMKRQKRLNIFCDPSYLKNPLPYFDLNKSIQIIPFADPIVQFLNVLCTANQL